MSFALDTKPLAQSPSRLGCLFYMIDLLFHIEGRTPSIGQCPEFVDLPLPCIRELWEPVSDREWEKRYQQHVAFKDQRRARGLTLGNLVLLRQSQLHGEKLDHCWEPGVADEMAEWCEKVDDFSKLVWMAFMIECSGQSFSRAMVLSKLHFVESRAAAS